MLSAVMLSALMLIAVMLSALMLRAVMLCAVMLNVIMLMPLVSLSECRGAFFESYLFFYKLSFQILLQSLSKP